MMINLISKLIIERPIESKIKNISLSRITWRRHVSLFCNELDHVVVFKKYPSLLNPRAEEHIDQRKRRRHKGLLNIKLLNWNVVSQCIVIGLIVKIKTCMHIEIFIEVDVFVRELCVDEDIGDLDSVICILEDLCVDRLAAENNVSV